eukprot:scaffold27784_cov66-Phaeocystis_antarctica.AAC.4
MRFGTYPFAGGPTGSSWSGCVPTPPAQPCGIPGHSAPGHSAHKPLPQRPQSTACKGSDSAVRPVLGWRPPRRCDLSVPAAQKAAVSVNVSSRSSDNSATSGGIAPAPMMAARPSASCANHPVANAPDSSATSGWMAPASLMVRLLCGSWSHRMPSAIAAYVAVFDSGPPDSSATSSGMAPALVMAAQIGILRWKVSMAKLASAKAAFAAASDSGPPDSSATSGEMAPALAMATPFA